MSTSSNGIERQPGERCYQLRCSACGETASDDGYRLGCQSCNHPSLLKSEYDSKIFPVRVEEEGLYRYRDWLPITRTIPGPGTSVTFQSKEISALSGLKNLWIVFNGYWPERGATLPTGSFKDLEAFAVLGRLPSENKKILTIASAGNTGAAFAYACSANAIPCLIIVPSFAMHRMLFTSPLGSSVKSVEIKEGGDYADAIKYSERISALEMFLPEGGARNVARRDGLGTVLLNAFETIGKLPDYYFQAIGSGSGAIAVHDAAKKLMSSNGTAPRLYLSQNLPFAPIFKAWRARTREWKLSSEEDAKREMSQMYACVLSNRRPPYSIPGGLFDALTDSEGEVFAVSEKEATAAAKLFEKSENIDIEPAAAVAFASLLKSASAARFPTDATILLNITGGGLRRRASSSSRLYRAQADLTVDTSKLEEGFSSQQVLEMYQV